MLVGLLNVISSISASSISVECLNVCTLGKQVLKVRNCQKNAKNYLNKKKLKNNRRCRKM